MFNLSDRVKPFAATRTDLQRGPGGIGRRFRRGRGSNVEPKRHEEARSSLERGSTVANDLVLTPGGYRPKSVVHSMEPGNHVSGENGRLRVLQPDGGVVIDFGPLPVRPAGVPLHPGNEFVPTEKVPGLGSGWITYASWTDNTGKPITSFTTTWTVPPCAHDPVGSDDLPLQRDPEFHDDLPARAAMGVLGRRRGQLLGSRQLVRRRSGRCRISQPPDPRQCGPGPGGVMTLTGQSGSNFSYTSRARNGTFP